MQKKLLFLILFFLFSICRLKAADTLDCRTYGVPFNGNQFNEIGYALNAQVGEYNGCQITPAMIIAIIDSSTCQPWNTCNNYFGQANVYDCITAIGTCRNRPENYFIFRFNDTSQVNSMIHLLDSIENGNYILAYTWFTYYYSTISNFNAFRNAFMNLGSSLMATTHDTVPYIFFCKKGTPSSVNEVTGLRMDDTLNLRVTFQCAVTSVQEWGEDHNFFVFPDPSSGRYNFYYKNKEEKISSIEIADETGRVVYSEMKNEHNIDISSAASGIYFYQVKTANNKIYRGKLLKQ